MGAIALIGLAVSAATGISQYKASKDASRAQRNANEISTAEGRIQDRAARAKAAREKRLRRARIINASEQAGSGGSSGEAGGLAALGSNFDRIIANQRGTETTRQGLSAANQKMADAEGAFQRAGAFGKFAMGALDVYEEYKKPVGSD
jgi:hypothetical protein